MLILVGRQGMKLVAASVIIALALASSAAAVDDPGAFGMAQRGTLKVVAGVPPKLTAVAPVRLVPAIVTLVPPPVGPDVGVRLVIVGAAT